MIQPHHQALIFDCDGTLADSMPAHYVAWMVTLRRYGLAHLLPQERFMALGGVPARVILQELVDEAGVTLDIAALAIEKEQAYIEAAANVQPIEPVLAIARANRGRLPMAVATGARRSAVTRTLTVIGVLDWFDPIVTSEDVLQHKPYPETFMRCAELMRVVPGRCLVFEDAEPGFIAARAAGMDVIDVREMRR